MSQLAAWSLVCGAVLGLGLWSIVSITPRFGRPRLVDRVAPYVLDVSEGARAHVAQREVNPLPVLGAILSPVFGWIGRFLATAAGGSEKIELRLQQVGESRTVEQYRSKQLVWALSGFSIGLAISGLTLQLGSLSPVLQLALPPVTGAVGFALCDYQLKHSAARRIQQIAGEIPTVLEFLTLSLSAGEGILDSLRRVAEVSSGELSREFAAVVADVNTGLPLGRALDDLVTRVQLPALNRCVEQISGALERGTPLSDVLRAQAQDSRDEAKRDLLEIAGKKEVAMLVPLVFLILPTTIAFAIFPGIFVLQAGF